MADGKGNQNLVKFIQGELAQGQNVVFGDSDHTSTLPRLVIGNPDLLAAIAKSGGTLILEGPQTKNDVVQDYYDGKTSEEQLRTAMHKPYQATDPAKAAEWNKAYSDVLVNARAARTHVFFPENDTLYKALENDPKGKALLEKFDGEVTSLHCAPVQLLPIVLSFTPEERQTFVQDLAPLIKQRLGKEENQKIIEGVTSRPGPYVALYGDAHRAQLIEGLKATSIGILASEKDAYQGMADSLPDYIYYKDSDRLLHIPPGSRERAEFQASHVTGPIYAGSVATGVALTDAEKQACIDALPAEVRGKPVPFPGVPPAPPKKDIPPPPLPPH